MDKFLFNKISLIGIGLIGSSIARKVQQDKIAKTIAITCASQKTLQIAKQLKLGDIYSLDIKQVVTDSDCVIICVPVGCYESIAKKIKPHLKKGAIVTDVGSVKSSVIKQVLPHLQNNVHFIPAHPIAGTEDSGPRAGFASLFENRWCILTPLKQTNKQKNKQALNKIKKFWQKLGMNVDVMSPKHHDRVLAITSHLPHLIAYNIVGTASDLENITDSEIMKFAAGGFRDFTRIAASDPTMWRDVFINNKQAVLEILGRFNEDLFALQRAIRWGDGKKLFNHFSHTKKIRKKIIKAGQETAKPDFGRNSSKNSGKNIGKNK